MWRVSGRVAQPLHGGMKHGAGVNIIVRSLSRHRQQHRRSSGGSGGGINTAATWS